MQVLGICKIFKKEYEGKELYSTSLTNKNMDGTYINMYISCQLPKGTSVENNTKINIKKGFMSFYRNKNGLAQPKVIVQEFEIVKPMDNMPKYEETPPYYTDGLPF